MTFPKCPHCNEEHAADSQWVCQARVNGDEPCIDQHGHKFVVSDDDENICYCERCGCGEY